MSDEQAEWRKSYEHVLGGWVIFYTGDRNESRDLHVWGQHELDVINALQGELARSSQRVVELEADYDRHQVEELHFETERAAFLSELARKDDALREIERMSTAASSGRYDPDAVNAVACAALAHEEPNGELAARAELSWFDDDEENP